MKRKALLRGILFSWLLWGAWIPFAVAHHDGQTKKPPQPALAPDASPSQDVEIAKRNYFTDLKLLTQDGKEVRFYTDVLKDRVVLLSFFYTQCKDACPLQSKVLADLQPMLGDHLGKEIFIVSLSVDPDRDSPAAMKAYAGKFHAQPGWLFLSGKKENVNWVIYKLGQYGGEDVKEHSTAYLAGNVKTARWKKVYPHAQAKTLALLLLSLAEENSRIRK